MTKRVNNESLLTVPSRQIPWMVSSVRCCVGCTLRSND